MHYTSIRVAYLSLRLLLHQNCTGQQLCLLCGDLSASRITDPTPITLSVHIVVTVPPYRAFPLL